MTRSHNLQWTSSPSRSHLSHLSPGQISHVHSTPFLDIAEKHLFSTHLRKRRALRQGGEDWQQEERERGSALVNLELRFYFILFFMFTVIILPIKTSSLIAFICV